MTTAFVIGNGVSRAAVDVAKLSCHGDTYGCNALYRTFAPTHLIAVDIKMIQEINESGYQHTHNVWTNYYKQYDCIENLNYFNPRLGWSSGPSALKLSSQHQHQQVYILGFDYQGLLSGKQFNNMYANTVNYKKSTDSATYYGNWLKQTQTVIKDNPAVEYCRVVNQNSFDAVQLNKFHNYCETTIDHFIEKYNCSEK